MLALLLLIALVAATPSPTSPPNYDGACCLNATEGVCFVYQLHYCFGMSTAVFGGVGTNCNDPGFCGTPSAPTPAPTSVPVGACCNKINFSCINSFAFSQCEIMNYTMPMYTFEWGGANTVCATFCGAGGPAPSSMTSGASQLHSLLSHLMYK
jgi:hypothetical protein